MGVMNREWKPGDVAIVLQSGCERIAFRNDTEWIDSMGAAWDDDEVTKYGRPIVALDPDDGLEVKRLADAFCAARWDHTGGGGECDPMTFSSMQAALREYANPTPPKPDEPQGLGAVVEDEDGVLWVRGYVNGDSTHEWHVIDLAGNKRMGWWKYDEINAVRVLSPGVEVGQ